MASGGVAGGVVSVGGIGGDVDYDAIFVSPIRVLRKLKAASGSWVVHVKVGFLSLSFEPLFRFH